MTPNATRKSATPSPSENDQLTWELSAGDPAQVVKRLEELTPHDTASQLVKLRPLRAEELLLAMDAARRQAVIAATPAGANADWGLNLSFPEDSIGRITERPHAVFPGDLSVAEAVERVRKLVESVFITYGFILDADDRLVGIITMRDLLLADREERLSNLMLRDPFCLRADDKVLSAMKSVVNKHFPVYPVCDAEGRLLGIVRGRTLFEQQAFEISAQAGSLVGVEKEERVSTSWQKSLRFRHPWLQLNLLTAFLAAGVVGWFQDTIDKMVVLAVFLPVLAGQSGNTGCQSLAVTLRGLTLGELAPGRERWLVIKEGSLGFLNGLLVGITAGIGMWVYAHWQQDPAAWKLGFIVMAAMTGSCVISGIAGALIPLGLRRLGADPATASSIFLTTATDIASMGLFLGLAKLLA